MVPAIGLIIAVYCMFRMIQLPLSMAAFEGADFLGLSGKDRLVIVSVLAGIAFCLIGLLSLVLLFGGGDSA